MMHENHLILLKMKEVLHCFNKVLKTIFDTFLHCVYHRNVDLAMILIIHLVWLIR